MSIELQLSDDRKLPETDIDITGAVLTPGRPKTCQGNGKHEKYECCCDECDWFLACFEKELKGEKRWE